MQTNGSKVFLSVDSEFEDAVLGGKLGALTKDGFNLWMDYDISTKGLYDHTTGKRSTLGLKIDREHNKSLVPSIKTIDICPCVDHGLARMVETLIKLLVTSLMQLSAVDCSSGRQRQNAAIAHLEANINQRWVRGGNFKFEFEDSGKGGKKLKDITLNKSWAWVIATPPEEFDSEDDEEPYCHLLENVIPKEPFSESVPEDLQQLLNIKSDTVTQFELKITLVSSISYVHNFSTRSLVSS